MNEEQNVSKRQEEEITNNNSDTLSWRAPEFPFWRKTAEWYSSVLIVGFAIFIASLILGNYIFGILVLISIFALLLTSSIPPKEITISLTRRGVRIGSFFYPYSVLESFWINSNEDPPRLYLKSRKTFSPLITIEIVNIEEDDVYHYLYSYLEQEELSESIFHRGMEYLGF